MAKRFEILGADRLAPVVQGNIESATSHYRGLGNYPAEKNQLSMRVGDLSYCYEFAAYQHLQLDIGAVHTDRYLREGARIAVDYFYGEFLKTNEKAARAMRKAESNRDLKWFEVYRDGLLLAFLAKDREAERKLVEWIEPGLPFDESSYLVTPEDNNYHKILAEFIKSGEIVSKPLESKIASARKPRPKLLLACQVGIGKQDVNEFTSNLKKFLDNFLKSEFGKSGVPTYISIEGSILWHLAKRARLEPTGLTEKQSALIMTRESLGLAA